MSMLEPPTLASLDSTLRQVAEPLLAHIPAHLREAILYSLLGPGKRIRPRLLLAVASAVGTEPEVALRLATAIEMIHAYTLIHDDLPAMDNDDFRRGRPTNHKVYGEATAVLAGDALALLGVDVILATEKISADRLLPAARLLLETAGARGVIAGQAAESALQAENPALPALLEVFRLKTGALFRASLALPVCLMPPSRETKQLENDLSTLGEAIGIAFQIADDLEDDFKTERTNPAHIASRASKEEARELARDTLEIAWRKFAGAPVGSVEARVRDALIPFREEIRVKLRAGESP
jgi:geranylgeranyl pyrophosphate synthase